MNYVREKTPTKPGKNQRKHRQTRQSSIPKKTNDEVHKIAIEYFSKKYKGRVLWVLSMK